MKADLIYDVGMNRGDDTAYYLSKGYRVVAIEADPSLVENARKRFAPEIDRGRLSVLNVGIGPEEGIAKFWICEGLSVWNSFDRVSASRLGKRCHAIDVPCRRFRNVLKEHGVPYYLKIDIEGHDHYCVADIEPKDPPKYVSLELERLEDLMLLRDLGYDSFKIITQNFHNQFRARPRSLKEGLKRRLYRYPRLGGALVSIKGAFTSLIPGCGRPAHRAPGPMPSQVGPRRLRAVRR
jgi:FkbM family methyltransferase